MARDKHTVYNGYKGIGYEVKCYFPKLKLNKSFLTEAIRYTAQCPNTSGHDKGHAVKVLVKGVL